MDPQDTESQIDTQSQGEKPQRDPAQDPRMLAMNSISVNREGMDDADTQIADQVAQQTAPEPVVLADGLDRTMAKVKVDGVESMVSVAELVTDYQKGQAAEKRFAEAARLKAEAEAVLAAAAAKPPATVDSDTPPAQTTNQPAPQGADTGLAAKEFLRALFDGDEEKAAERLQELVSGGRATGSTQMDPDQLAAQLTPAIRQQLQNDSALDKFLETNATIANDPHLAQMTAGYLDEELRGGKAYPDALADAGRRTSEWMARMGIAQAPTRTDPTMTRDDKLARKGQIDDIRPASTSAASTVAQPQTASQVINDMRKARGLPV